MILSIILVLLGTAIAHNHGSLNLFHAFLCLVGLILLHSSTNVLNDYFDYTSGIDLNTKRTPFSGGSGIINAGIMTPKETMVFGFACFLLAAPIGGYFVYAIGIKLLPLFIVGSLFVLLGTSHLFKAGFALAELAAGLGLGSLPVLGTAWILEGRIDSRTLFACVPSGILVFNLLFLNEFPDFEADARGGRKTLAIVMGLNRASKLYAILCISVYLWIIAGVILKIIPWQALLSLLSIPLAIKAIKGSGQFNTPEKLIPGLGANIGMILGTQALMAVGYFLNSFMR